MDNRSSRRNFDFKMEWDILNQFLKDHPLPKEPFVGYDPGGPDQGATHANARCNPRFVKEVVLVGGQATGLHTEVTVDMKELKLAHIPEIHWLPVGGAMVEQAGEDVYEQYAEVCTGKWDNPDDIVYVFKYKDENRRPQ